MSTVQSNPRRYSKYTYGPLVIDRSPTNSIESYLNLADKEAQILRRNPRDGNCELVIHILKPLGAKELRETRKKILFYLRKGGLTYFANTEPTGDGFGNPTDAAHMHVIADDTRGETAMRELGYASCMSAGLHEKGFRIDYRELYDYNGYIGYITKCIHQEKIHLFERGTRIRRFMFSPDWYIDAEGNNRKKGDIWNEIIEETRARHDSKRGIEPVMDEIPGENDLPIPATSLHIPATELSGEQDILDFIYPWDDMNTEVDTMSAYDLHDTLDIAYPWDDDTMLEHDQQDIVDLYELPWEVDSTPEHIDHTRRVHKVDKQQDIAEWIEKWVTEHIYSRSKEDDWYLMDDLWYEPAIPARRVHPMQPARRHRE